MSEFIVTKNHHEAFNKNKLRNLFILNFIFNSAIALTSFFESAYLSKFFSEDNIGLIFSSGYLLVLLVILFHSKLINIFGKYFIISFNFILFGICMFVLSFTDNVYLIFAGFVVFLLSCRLALLGMDIILEENCVDNATGKVRGYYYTLISVAWLAMPFIGGYLIKNNFSLLFMVSAFLGVLALIFFLLGFHHERTDNKLEDGLVRTAKQFIANRQIYEVFFLSFLLNSFFAVTIVYIPIYLLKLGFNYREIGIVFTVMLFPYLIEYLFGQLLDKHKIEKYVLSIALFFLAGSSLGIFFFAYKSLVFWAVILFLSRIGTMLLEIGSDVYFYKQIDKEDVNLINFYRNSAPLAYVIMPVLSGICIDHFGLDYIFLFLGGFVLIGYYFVFRLPNEI
jgi:MFS family permease